MDTHISRFALLYWIDLKRRVVVPVNYALFDFYMLRFVFRQNDDDWYDGLWTVQIIRVWVVSPSLSRLLTYSHSGYVIKLLLAANATAVRFGQQQKPLYCGTVCTMLGLLCICCFVSFSHFIFLLLLPLPFAVYGFCVQHIAHHKTRITTRPLYQLCIV